MLYLLCEHKVADFDKWHRVFKSHAEAQMQAELRLLYLLRDAADPNNVILLFRAENQAKAQAFMDAPDLRETMQASGVIGTPKLLWLND